MSSRISALVLAAALGGAAVAPSCGFPEIEYIGTGSGMLTGAGGDGGAGATGGGGPGGSGGAGGMGGAGGAGGGIPADCDVDDDGEMSVLCDGGTDCDDDGDQHDAEVDACPGGDDCDDADAEVHPGVVAFFAVASKSGSFDYNCDGVEEPEISYLKCGPVCVNTTMNVFLDDAACGKTGEYGDCLAVSCNEVVDDQSKVRTCH